MVIGVGFPLPVMFFRAVYIYKYILHIFTGAIIAQIRDSGGRKEGLSVPWNGRTVWVRREVSHSLPLLRVLVPRLTSSRDFFRGVRLCRYTVEWSRRGQRREDLFIGKCCHRRGGFEMCAVEEKKNIQEMPTRYFFPFVVFRIIAPPFSAARRERKCDKKKWGMLVIGRKRNLHASDVVYTDLCTVSTCVLLFPSRCVFHPCTLSGRANSEAGSRAVLLLLLRTFSFSFFPPREEVVL